MCCGKAPRQKPESQLKEVYLIRPEESPKTQSTKVTPPTVPDKAVWRRGLTKSIIAHPPERQPRRG